MYIIFSGATFSIAIILILEYSPILLPVEIKLAILAFVFFIITTAYLVDRYQPR